jgi:hypothetical protein
MIFSLLGSLHLSSQLRVRCYVSQLALAFWIPWKACGIWIVVFVPLPNVLLGSPANSTKKLQRLFEAIDTPQTNQQNRGTGHWMGVSVAGFPDTKKLNDKVPFLKMGERV